MRKGWLQVLSIAHRDILLILYFHACGEPFNFTLTRYHLARSYEDSLHSSEIAMGTFLSRPVGADDSGRGLYRIRFSTTNPRRIKKRSTPSSPELYNAKPTTSPALHPPTPAEPKSSTPKSTDPYAGRGIKSPLGVVKNVEALLSTDSPGSTTSPHGTWHIRTRTQSESFPKVILPSFAGPTATPKPNVLFRGQGRLGELFRACFGPGGEYIALPASTQPMQESQTRQELSLGVAFTGKMTHHNAPPGLVVAKICLGTCIVLVMVTLHLRKRSLLGVWGKKQRRRTQSFSDHPSLFTDWERGIDFTPLFLSFVPDPPLPVLPSPDPALLDLPCFAPRPRRPYRFRFSTEIQTQETERVTFLALLWAFLALQKDQAMFREGRIRRRSLVAAEVVPAATTAFIEEVGEDMGGMRNVGIRMISRCTSERHHVPSMRHWGRERDRVDVDELNAILDDLLQHPALEAQLGNQVISGVAGEVEGEEDTMVEPVAGWQDLEGVKLRVEGAIAQIDDEYRGVVDRPHTLALLQAKMGLVKERWGNRDQQGGQIAKGGFPIQGPRLSLDSSTFLALDQQADQLLQERTRGLKAKLAEVKKVLYGEKDDGAAGLYKKVLEALKAEKDLAVDQLGVQKAGRSGGVDSEQTTLCGDNEEQSGIFGYEKWREMISLVNELEKEVVVLAFDEEIALSTPKLGQSTTGMKALRSCKNASGQSFYVHTSTLGSQPTVPTAPTASSSFSASISTSTSADFHCTSFEFEHPIPGDNPSNAPYPSITSRVVAMHKNPVHTVQMREQVNVEKSEKEGLLVNMRERGEVWGMREWQRGREGGVEEEVLAGLETARPVLQPQAPKRNNSQTRGKRPGRRSRMGGWI